MHKTHWLSGKHIFISLFFILSTFIAISVVNETSAQPTPPDPGSTLEQRVEQRKAEQAIVLDAKQIKRIEEQCRTSQPRISRLVEAADKLLADRLQKYNRIDAAILVSIGKLKLANKDTFYLESFRDEYNNAVEVFKTNHTSYRQSMDDMVVMNCQADPVGFKALLETARIYNSESMILSSDISRTVIDNIKPIIDEYAKELE